jgi:putative ABC transport system permease protein
MLKAAELAFQNLRSKPTRNLLLATIVALAVATALTLFVLADSIKEGLRAGSDERGADLTISQRDAADLLSGYVPIDLEPRLAIIPGVAAVSGELVMFAPVDKLQSIVVGWTSNAYFWRQLPLSAGRLPKEADDHPAILGSGIAESLKKRVGSNIEIFGESFNVIGLAGYSSAMNRSMIILRVQDLENLSMRRGQVTAFHLALRRNQSPTDVTQIKEKIQAMGKLTVSPTDQLLANDRNYRFLQAVSRAISMIAFIMGSLSTFSTLLMAVTERRREIGILMALGWSDISIRATILFEGIIIGLLGGVLACPLVLLASLLFRHLPGIGDILSFRLSAGMVALGLAGSTFFCAIGSLYPAVLSTRLIPSQVLRAP